MEDHVNKRVLIIAYYFPPLGGGGTFRSLKYVKYLSQFGWQPEVLTVKNAHYLVNDENLYRQVPADVVVHRTPAFLPGRFFRRVLKYDQAINTDISSQKPTLKNSIFNFIKKCLYTFLYIPDEYIGWLPFAVIAGWKLMKRKKITIIYTTAPPNSLHLIGWLLHKFTGVRWVADFRDLWDQYPDSYNPFHLEWKTALDRFLERRVLRSADRSVLVSQIMKQQLLQKFPDVSEKKYEVITNGFDPTDFRTVTPLKKNPDTCVILHTGTLFSWRRSTVLFRTFRQLITANPEFSSHVKLQLMGIVHPDVRQEIFKLGLESMVDICAYQPYTQMIRHLKSSDFLLLIIGNQPKAANVLTLKLFDYIGAKKPILAIAPQGEVSKIITTYQLGLVAAPDNEDEIHQMFLSAFQSWKNGRRLVRDEDFEAVSSVFNRQKLTCSLAKTFRQLDEN